MISLFLFIIQQESWDQTYRFIFESCTMLIHETVWVHKTDSDDTRSLLCIVFIYFKYFLGTCCFHLKKHCLTSVFLFVIHIDLEENNISWKIIQDIIQVGCSGALRELGLGSRCDPRSSSPPNSCPGAATADWPVCYYWHCLSWRSIPYGCHVTASSSCWSTLPSSSSFGAVNVWIAADRICITEIYM